MWPIKQRQPSLRQIRNVTLAVVDSINERCLQWIGRDCWRMRLKDNMNPTIFMY